MALRRNPVSFFEVHLEFNEIAFAINRQTQSHGAMT